MEYEGLTFVEAVRKLADRIGLRLPALSERDNKEEYQRVRLIELGTFALGFFRDTLNSPLKGSLARKYLQTRQLKPETVKRFGLGYAPDGWSSLLEAARNAGFKDPILEASGLVKRGEGGALYDFFRNRLMVPIRNVSGNVVAFGGRDLGDGNAKYINSPENTVYKKGAVLYGLYEAREGMRREKRVILVEGYFDLMRCFDTGIGNVVATCGTALTPQQAALIHRYVPEVVVVFDADPAGIRAASRGIGVLTDAGLTVRAMILPEGKDPDDYVKAHGADAFLSLVDNALDFVAFYVRAHEERLQTIEGRTEVAREIFSILSNVKDQMRREEYLKQTAEELHLNEWTCRAEFSKFVRQQTARTPKPQTEDTPERLLKRDDVDFIAMLLANESRLKETKQQLAGMKLLSGPVTDILEALFTGADAAQELETEEARSLYAAAANSDVLAREGADELVKGRIAQLKKDSLRARADLVQQELEQAEHANDQPRVMELLALRVSLSKQIDAVGVS